MSSLTIVVPRLGSDAAFETTLASILRYRLPHHQVIVVQAPENADDYGLGDEARFLTCHEAPGLAHFVSQAIPIATGNVISLISPGAEVNHQWFAPAMREMNRPDAGCVSIPVFNGDRLVSLGLGINGEFFPNHILKKHSRVAGPTRWGGCYRRSLLAQLGFIKNGLCDDLFGLEVGLAAGRLGLHCLVAKSGSVTLDETTPTGLPGGFKVGQISRRLQYRYASGDQSVFGKIVSSIRFGLQLAQPHYWTYLAGRKSAKQSHDGDEEISGQLDVMADHVLDAVDTAAESRRSPRRAA